MKHYRIPIIQAVLQGQLEADALSMEELAELEDFVINLVEEKTLLAAVAQGKIVFSGTESKWLN